MKELHSLWMAAVLLDLITKLLADWLEGKLQRRYLFGDSRIALAWTVYETTRLLPFYRHQVMEIGKLVDQTEMYHCPGYQNPTDGGTKLKDVSTSLVGPDSIWENGHEWMKGEEEEISDTLMSVADIKLDDAQKKVVNEALIAPKFESEIRGYPVCSVTVESDNFNLRMELAPYMQILSPLKFSHRFVVRVYGYVVKFCRCLRAKVNERRLCEGLEPRKPLELEVVREQRLDIFSVNTVPGSLPGESCTMELGSQVEEQVGPVEGFEPSMSTAPSINHHEPKTPEDDPDGLLSFFGCVAVVLSKSRDYGSSSYKKRWPDEPEKWIPRGRPRFFPYKTTKTEIYLTTLDLSAALIRIFQWTSQEVREFNDKAWISKNCEEKDGILIRKGRLVEEHEVEVTGGAEKYVNAGELTNQH